MSDDEKHDGWFTSRRVEARVVFITTEEFDYAKFEAWRAEAMAWEDVTMNVSPVTQWGSRRKPSRYTSIDMRVVPTSAAVLGWTTALTTDAASWFLGLLAAALKSWPDLTFERAELEIR